MKTRRISTALAALALAALAGSVLTGCSTGSDIAPEKKPAATASPQQTPAGCEYVTGGDAAKKVDLPATDATLSGAVMVTLKTSIGDLTVQLDADHAPCTVGSFVSLSEQGFFDGTSCHRLTTEGIYVLQCGDPTGTGMGGPGYSFADELDGTSSSDYITGTLAMANAGPDTNGSQFFLVYDDSTGLPADYTVFGFLEPASLELVKSAAAAGTVDGGSDGAPKKKVTIESATVG